MNVHALLDEFPITVVPDVEDWSENYALAGYSPKSGIDLFIHIGRWRKDLSLWREIVMFALPDGSVLAHRGIGNALQTARGPGGANTSIEVIEEYSRLVWRYFGPCRRVMAVDLLTGVLTNGIESRMAAELTFNSTLPVWDLSHIGESTDFMGRGHIEQLGHLTGWIEFGKETFTIDTIVNRDHSRGPRVVDGIKRHIWMHGVFENDLAFLCYEAETSTDGVVYSEACIYDNGKLYPATLDLKFRLPLVENGPMLETRVPFTINYNGRSLSIIAESFPTTLGYHYTHPWEFYIGRKYLVSETTKGGIEQSALFTLDGTIRGYGHVERTVPGTIIQEDRW